MSEEDFAKVTIAYEPVWAIGTGKTCSSDDAQTACGLIRQLVSSIIVSQELAENTYIIYGGSSKPSNVQELCAMPDIDGLLVGGASLKPADFSTMINLLAR